MSDKNDILNLLNSMNNLPKDKNNYHGINIENTTSHALDYEELVKWCEQNCKHPWKGLINNEYQWWTSPPDFTFLFKHDDDATFFKLIWKM